MSGPWQLVSNGLLPQQGLRTQARWEVGSTAESRGFPSAPAILAPASCERPPTREGTFHFLSGCDRKPNQKPISLNVPVALTGTKHGNAEGCSKSHLHRLEGNLPTRGRVWVFACRRPPRRLRGQGALQAERGGFQAEAACSVLAASGPRSNWCFQRCLAAGLPKDPVVWRRQAWAIGLRAQWSCSKAPAR